MGKIADKVALFNLAYKLAWKYVSDEAKFDPNKAKQLDQSIRRQLNAGANDAVFIASAAIDEVAGSRRR